MAQKQQCFTAAAFPILVHKNYLYEEYSKIFKKCFVTSLTIRVKNNNVKKSTKSTTLFKEKVVETKLNSSSIRFFILL